VASKKNAVKLLELEPNLVLLFSVIAIPVIILGGLLILGSVRAEMNHVVGDDLLGGTAEDTARYLDSYLLSSFTTVSMVAASSDLHQATDAANLGYRGQQPSAIEERLKKTDEEWTGNRGAIPLAVEIIGRRASDYLREIAALHPSYKEMLLTDRFGALLAATNITTDYYQADEEWWQKAFGDGEDGALFIGDVRFDRSAGAYTIEVAVPVRRRVSETYEVSGVLKALIGADELFSVIGAIKRGESGHALLVSIDDGTVIAGPERGDVMRRKYPAFAQLEESLAVAGSRAFVGRQGDDLWLAAYARMPQPSLAPYGHWVVVVQERYHEIHAATRRATTYLVAFFIGMVVLVLGFSLYLHYKLVKPIREIDLREEMDRLAEPSPSS
jgi:hypothetical protein